MRPSPPKTETAKTIPDSYSSFPRNLRLALVMNGGVSLAVWMSGATHELNNCRLASSTRPATTPSRKAWQDILLAADTTVAIDLIAGTSAGGLNGTVLAKAIAANQDLPAKLRELWFDRAAVSAGKLLAHKPIPAASLLDGKYLRDEVRDLLATPGPVEHSPKEQPTVTLLVTATALPISDDGGPANGVPDSRRVYRFVAKPGVAAGLAGVPGLPALADRNDFFDTDSLTSAARASAAFPAAFQPERADDLQKYLKGGRGSGGQWLMDGGVLDNAPFEPLLDELRRRSVSDRFSRAVVYINPSAAPVRKKPFAATGGVRDAPGILTTLAAFVRTTREPDRRLDVEGLNDALKAMGFATTDPDHVLAHIFRPGPQPLTLDGLPTAASPLFEQYQANRRRSLFLTATGAETLITSPLPLRSTPPDATSPLLVPAVRGLPVGQDWHWGLGVADRLLRWWGRALAEQQDSIEQREAFAALGPAQRLIQSWGDDFDAAVAPQRGDLAAWINAAETYLVREQIPTLLTRLMRSIAVEVAPVLGAASAAVLLDASLDLEVVNRSLSWRAETQTDVPSFESWSITPDAEPPFDLGLSDADRPLWPSKKLYGERWGHFGAFASVDGRRWDWTWGRLDAAMTLSGRILSEAGVDPTRSRRLQTKLVAAICAEEDQDEAVLRRKAAPMIQLTQGDLWATFRREANWSTRRSLRRLASRLLGDLVPKSWPVPVHAIVDKRELWREHVPDADRRRSMRTMRVIGVIARLVAKRKVAKLVRPQETEADELVGG